jgi:hypothetical protein
LKDKLLSASLLHVGRAVSGTWRGRQVSFQIEDAKKSAAALNVRLKPRAEALAARAEHVA